MDEERKGVLTPKQEKILDDLYVAKGIKEVLSDLAIKYGDNLGLEALKKKIPEEYLPAVYAIVDSLFLLLEPLSKKES